MDWDEGVCSVYPSGGIDGYYQYNIKDSYSSPYTGWMQYSLANLLSPEGELILSDGSMPVFDSYGKTFFPGTIYPNFSRIVNDRGLIEYRFDDNDAYVDDSYGTLRTSIMYIHGSLV